MEKGVHLSLAVAALAAEAERNHRVAPRKAGVPNQASRDLRPRGQVPKPAREVEAPGNKCPNDRR